MEKSVAREETRKVINQHMQRMLGAQIEAACGVAHLMLRNEDGTWSKAPEAMTADEMLAVLNGDKSRYFIATKDPNTPAFNTLAAYALDKPAEQLKVTGGDGGPVELITRVAAARKRLSGGE
jgi:hypothetical protein